MRQSREKARFAGASILIVEDDFFIAESMRLMLSERGAHVLGPAPTCDDAMAIIRDRPVSMAVLDLALREENSMPVACELLKRGVPFLLVTGFSDDEILPSKVRNAPRLTKPALESDLLQSIQSILDDALEPMIARKAV